MLAATTSAVPVDLNQQHVTLRFEGTMITHWSVGPDVSDDGCVADTHHGNGTQTVDYKTHGVVNMTLVDSGGNLAFQADDRASEHHAADGFRYAHMNQLGTIEDDYTPSKGPTAGCPPLPDPPEQTQNDTGCGGEQVPWDAQFAAFRNRFQVFVSAFPSENLVAECPFEPVHGHGPAGQIGSFPPKTQETVPTDQVRHALERTHGRFIIHGSQHWSSSGKFGGYTTVARTSVTWKATFTRAHP